MPLRVSAANAPPQDSARRATAAGLAGVGAVLLGIKAAFTFGATAYDPLAPLAGSFVAVLAGAALAAGVSALRAPELTRVLLAVVLGGALVGDFLLAAPPRHLYLLPLAIATGLVFIAPPARPPTGQDRSMWPDVPGWLGVVLHAAVGLLYLMSGLTVPAYGVLFLWALWAVLLVIALRLLRDRPSRTPAVPVAAAGLWFVIVYLGRMFLGWTA